LKHKFAVTAAFCFKLELCSLKDNFANWEA